MRMATQMPAPRGICLMVQPLTTRASEPRRRQGHCIATRSLYAGYGPDYQNGLHAGSWDSGMSDILGGTPWDALLNVVNQDGLYWNGQIYFAALKSQPILPPIEDAVISTCGKCEQIISRCSPLQSSTRARIEPILHIPRSNVLADEKASGRSLISETVLILSNKTATWSLLDTDSKRAPD
ncbi:hypothetical protein F5Y18DRAFT_163261 [Xylariaceae sp. FL1019]|nr:hypothetical protein F5Y18DRAFT_163261 [Xylariaceae sp. FL1019]